jgi:hypothetical protein
MKRLRGQRAITVAGTVTAVLLGAAGGALAASATSTWDRFYTSANGGRCGAQKADINTSASDVWDISWVRARTNNCNDAYVVPAGQLAVEGGVVSGTSGVNGTLCGWRDWYYNDASTDTWGIYVYRTSFSGACTSGHAWYGDALGRIWQPSTNSYVTSTTPVYSPNLNW